MPQQFKNPANPEIHRQTTAEEIWRDSGGKVDILVSRRRHRRDDHRLRRGAQERKPSVRIVAVEPVNSPVISSDAAAASRSSPARTRSRASAPGFIPDVLNTEIIDEVVTVRDEDAFEMSRRLAREEGMLCGISCGAALAGAIQVASRPRTPASCRGRPARPGRALSLDAAVSGMTTERRAFPMSERGIEKFLAGREPQTDAEFVRACNLPKHPLSGRIATGVRRTIAVLGEVAPELVHAEDTFNGPLAGLPFWDSLDTVES